MRLQEAARELASQYDQIKSEAQRRLGSLSNASDYPQTLDGPFDLEVSYPTIEPQTLRDSNRLQQMVARDFEQIQASVGDLLVDRPRRNTLRRGGVVFCFRWQPVVAVNTKAFHDLNRQEIVLVAEQRREIAHAFQELNAIGFRG